MWDARSYREQHRLARLNHDMTKIRALRISVFANTVELVGNGSYRTESGIEVTIPHDRRFEEGGKVYAKKLPIKPEGNHAMHIEVANEDCLHAAKRIGNNPLVLNMANRYRPGGGVEGGSGAQEEHLFRSSNYFLSLFRFRKDYALRYHLTPAEQAYPIKEPNGAIYTPKATVFRGTEEEGYPLLEKPFSVSFLAMPAIDGPPLHQDEKGMWSMDNASEAITLEKIRTILSIAASNGHDNLVLSAFGCGVFANPPTQMAALFQRVLCAKPFDHAFEHVVFAIKEDDNSHGRQNREGNYPPFARTFASGDTF